MRLFCIACLFLLFSASAVSQERSPSRGSIPEELIRPGRGEAPRLPRDMVIGDLGRGGASVSAYNFASSILDGFMSNLPGHPALSSIEEGLRDSHLASINIVDPFSSRIGGGRVEADGTVSFLIRFIGSELGITGELYVRYVTRQIQGAEGQMITTGSWTFDEMLLEEPQDRELEAKEAMNRNDFYPYERFF